MAKRWEQYNPDIGDGYLFMNLQVSEKRNVYIGFLQNYVPMEAKWLPHTNLKVYVI